MVEDGRNSSGEGRHSEVPPEIDRWNWGAFLMNWIWGLGNSTPIALIALLPPATFVMPFILGLKGSAWAWQNRHWHDVKQFKAAQRRWAVWGLAAWLVALALIAAAFFSIVGLIRNNDVFTLAVTRAKANPELIAALGTPVTAGTPAGSVTVNDSAGAAAISFPAEGPKGRGVVFVEAVLEQGEWKIKRMALQLERSGKRIELVGQTTET